ncbi:MAG: aminoacyl-tRNA hydrolase [Firmicutes bacterium]|nr:aminoacyl-tRNA hydrolase [Bacillota bacterium]
MGKEAEVASPWYAVVGLGNPGPAYAQTRHNVGFCVVDQLAQQFHLRLAKRRWEALVATTFIDDKRLLLVQPQTFMNESGRAVAALTQWYRLPESHLLVVYDDLDLPPGSLRLRAKGQAGGHRGMASIIAALGTQAFPRLRVGIGHPGDRDAVISYVLGVPTGPERERLQQAIAVAAEAVLCWLREGIDQAMTRYNQAR